MIEDDSGSEPLAISGPRLASVWRSRLQAAGLGLLLGSAARAQELPRGGTAGVALGIAGGGTSVGGESEESGGLVAGAVAGYAAGRVRFLLEGQLQAFEIDNPVRAESFRALYLLAAPELEIGRLFVRPGAGITSFFFSGDEASDSHDIGLGLGGTIGYRWPLRSSRWLGVEGLARWGSTSDGELESRLYGVQASLSWVLR